MSENYDSGNKLAKLATNAIFGIGGGIVLIIVSVLLRRIVPPVGIAIGLIVTVFGVIGIFSKDKDDKKGGFIALITGVVLVLSFQGVGLVRAIAGSALAIGAFVSIGMGILNGLRFLIGLKKRM